MTLLFLLLGLGLILSRAPACRPTAPPHWPAASACSGIHRRPHGGRRGHLDARTDRLVLSAAGGHSGMGHRQRRGLEPVQCLRHPGRMRADAPLPFTPQNIRRDIPVSLGASVLLLALCLPPGHRAATIGRIEGAAMLLLTPPPCGTPCAPRPAPPGRPTPGANRAASGSRP